MARRKNNLPLDSVFELDTDQKETMFLLFCRNKNALLNVKKLFDGSDFSVRSIEISQINDHLYTLALKAKKVDAEPF